MRRHTRRSVLALAAALALTMAWPLPAAARVPFAPVDLAAQQPDFLAFRVRLIDAVKRRDAAFLLGILSADIRNSFGGDGGVAAFAEQWNPREPNSELWPVLAEVLRLGGRFDAQGHFIAPYVFANWPNGLDAMEHVAIVSEGVRIRANPAPDARVIGGLGHVIMRSPSEVPAVAGWVRIVLDDGTVGYVAERFARRATDYRARFERREGRWRMTMLLAGD